MGSGWTIYFLPASLETLENGIKSHFQNWHQWPDPTAELLPQEPINPGLKYAHWRLVEPALYPFFLPPGAGPAISLLLLLPDSLPPPPTILLQQLQPLCQDKVVPSLQEVTFCCLWGVGHTVSLLFLYIPISKSFYCCFCSHPMEWPRTVNFQEQE